MITAPRGTGDLLPPSSDIWAKLEQRLREISYRYNFHEIRTPTFEHTELFARTVGEATDIVEKEMYSFKDKGGRDITLRPEGTASVARAFVEHSLAQVQLPQKLFYIGSMFRYEKPQAGRFREFHQYGAEILGSASALSDIEIILMAVDMATDLGLTGTTLVINTIGCPKCRPLYRENLVKYFESHYETLCDDCKSRLTRNPLRILDCKNPSCREIAARAPVAADFLCDECKTHWEELTQGLTREGISYTVDRSLVRGLDYYTRTVFELKWPPLGAQDAILGGGRYDGLVAELGGEPTPGVGFAMGLERLMVAVEKGARPLAGVSGLDAFVVLQDPKDPGMQGTAIRIMRDLRRAGFRCDFDHLGRSFKSQMKYANKLSARYVLIIGENELMTGQVSVKSMEQGFQHQVPVSRVQSFLEEVLSK